MNREIEHVIDLGAVSGETRGGAFTVEDSDQSKSLPIGITDD